MLLALSAGQKTGLALVGAAFIAFALASALWLPRLRPNYPGRGLRLFIVVTLVFTVGMLVTVIALGKESEEKGAEAETTTAAATTTTATTTATPSAPATTAPAPAPAGDAAAGKALFASKGCGSCHTYGPAGSKGTIGPNLDNLAADAQKANRGSLDAYIHESVGDPNAYVVPGFPKGVMPTFDLSQKQLDDLIAFLAKPS